MRKRSGYGADLKSSIFFQNKKYFVDPISRNFNKTTKVLSLYGVSLTLLGYTLKGQKNSVHPDEKYFFRLLAQKIEVSFFWPGEEKFVLMLGGLHTIRKLVAR